MAHSTDATCGEQTELGSEWVEVEDRETEGREIEARKIKALDILARTSEAREIEAWEFEARENAARENAARETEARKTEARKTERLIPARLNRHRRARPQIVHNRFHRAWIATKAYLDPIHSMYGLVVLMLAVFFSHWLNLCACRDSTQRLHAEAGVTSIHFQEISNPISMLDKTAEDGIVVAYHDERHFQVSDEIQEMVSKKQEYAALLNLINPSRVLQEASSMAVDANAFTNAYIQAMLRSEDAASAIQSMSKVRDSFMAPVPATPGPIKARRRLLGEHFLDPMHWWIAAMKGSDTV